MGEKSLFHVFLANDGENFKKTILQVMETKSYLAILQFLIVSFVRQFNSSKS